MKRNSAGKDQAGLGGELTQVAMLTCSTPDGAHKLQLGDLGEEGHLTKALPIKQQGPAVQPAGMHGQKGPLDGDSDCLGCLWSAINGLAAAVTAYLPVVQDIMDDVTLQHARLRYASMLAGLQRCAWQCLHDLKGRPALESSKMGSYCITQ